MSSGDTAIFGNGSYSTPSCNLVYGSPSNGYTTIKAEQMGGVSMGGVNCQFSTGTHPAYWTFDGLLFTSNTIVANVDHIKFLRNGSPDGGAGNSANFAAGQGASYILFENNYAWGQGRYKFLAWHANNIVMRGNVARLDAEPFSDNQNLAGLVMYTMSNGEMHNNIVIDSDHPELWPDGIRNGCYYFPTTSGSTTNINMSNNVCLNSALGGIQEDGYEGGGGNYSQVNATNNVIWDAWSQNGWLGINYSRGSKSVWSGNTFGVGRAGALSYMSLYASNGVTVYNNIFYNPVVSTASSWTNGSHDYNVFYSASGLPSLSGHESTSKNPIWNASTNSNGALKYITRIEAGSNLAGSGQSGANIGATLQYMVGVPGTMYGEPGYNTVQSTPMWPFPHEDVIKMKMAAYSYGTLSGARGFAAPGTGKYGGPITLTSYVWEYLGNPCPVDICSQSSTTTLSAPTDLRIN